MLRNVLAWLDGTAIRDSIANLPEAEVFRQFARSFEPQGDMDYGWFVTQSAREFDFAEGRAKNLDEKADTLIGYLGAVEGILTLAMVYVIGAGHAMFLWVSVPTLIALLAAILLALVSRSPALHPALPSVQQFLEQYPRGNAAKFSARVCATARIASLANAQKARLVRRSHWFLVFGLTWFVIGSLAYAFIEVF